VDHRAPPPLARAAASLLAPVGADPVVRAFYPAQRRRQLEWLAGLRGGRQSASGRQVDALRLYTFERACDATASGEIDARGLFAERFEALLVEQMARAWRA
jgi:hypothetical protein